MKFTMLGNYYAHPYHSVRELRRGNERKSTILWVNEKFSPGSFISQFYKANFRFSRRKTSFTNPWMRYHTFIRLPFFWYERNNSGIRIGTWHHYLWFIRPVTSSL